jgi:hypothetical protein
MTKVREMQNVHACSKFKKFYSYVVERQKIGRKPFFINFSKKTFFDPRVILAKLTFFPKKAKK